MNLTKPIVLLAFAAEKAGMPRRAQSIYQAAAKAFDCPDSWFRLGRMAFQSGAWDKGIVCFKEAVRTRPGDAESHFKLGVCQMKRAMWNDAVKNIGTAIQLDPAKTQWKTQYNEALGKAGKRPAFDTAPLVPPLEIENLARLLQVMILTGRSGEFDSLHALAVSSFGNSDPAAAARLAILEAERHATAGDSATAAAIAEDFEGSPAHASYLKAMAAEAAGDPVACMDHLQEFLADYPEAESGVRMMARAAGLAGHPEIAWRALKPLLASGAQSSTWREASRLVSDRTDFNRLFKFWSAFKKTYKPSPYYVKVARHVAAASIRAGNTGFGVRLLAECALSLGKTKLGPPSEFFDVQNHPEYANLPDSLTWPEGIAVHAFEPVAARHATAMAGLVALFDAAGFSHCLIRRSLALAVRSGASPSLHDVLEIGVFGDSSAEKIHACLSKCPDFLVAEKPGASPGVLHCKHAGGISIRIFLHHTADGVVKHRIHGVEWSQPVFGIARIESHGVQVPVPADPAAYLGAFFDPGSALPSALDYMTSAKNAVIADKEAYGFFLYDALLECAILGDDPGVQKCVQNLSDAGEHAFVRKFFGENGNYCDANLPQLLRDKPKVILYLSGLENVAYQGNQWIPVLEKLPVSCAIVIRERRIASQLMPTKLPVYFFESLRDLEYLEEAGVRTILYPANSQKATQSLRLNRLNHFFINHGESDKVVNQSKFLMAYDKLLVAGPLAERRLRDAGLPVRDDQVIHVGRPQTELMLKRVSAPASSVKTVFYAPTWEGFNDEANYSSVNAYGLAMMEALARCGDLRVVFKPHPYTGHSNPNEAGEYLKKMLQVAEKSGIKVVDSKEGIFDCMNESDLLITDVSSVLNDYLFTLKPMILTNPKARPHDELRKDYPSSRATYILDEGAGIGALIADISRDDPMFSARKSVCADSLGEFPDGSMAEFTKVILGSVEEDT